MIKRIQFYKLFPFVVFFAFSVMGVSCDVLTENISQDPTYLVGTWKLTKQSGALQDVCPDEQLVLTSSNQATLQCPGSVAITRTYNVANGILTYVETGIKFEYQIKKEGTTTTLELYGVNVSRNLFYTKQSDSSLLPNASGNREANTNNSSENVK